jgi:type II secretory pathway component PulK
MMNRQGSILIFTLWVLLILAILSVVLSHRASTDVKLAKYEADNIKATYLARAGVMKMLVELAKDTNSYDSLNEDWNRTEHNPKKLILRDNAVLYGASDESARLNLNSSTLKKEYLVNLGIDDACAQKIVDYKIGKGNKGFEFMEELFLVEGMTHEKYSAIEDSLTIYRGQDSQININTASSSVLEAIIEDSALAQEVLDYRKGPDGEGGTDDDGIFKNASDISVINGLDPALFTVKSGVFRIWAQTFLSGEKEIIKTIEAVADRIGKIYHWKEY